MPDPQVRRLTNAEYHGDHAAISKSMLNVYADSPPTYRDRFVTHTAPAYSDPDEPKLMGDLIHTYVFAPNELIDGCVQIPDSALTNGKVKQRRGANWKAFVAANPGKKLITASQFDRVFAAGDHLKRQAARYFQLPGYVEVSLYWDCPCTGLRLKCRPDKILIIDQRITVVDIKTLDNITRFVRSARQFRYWLQEAHYREGIRETFGAEPVDFVFLVVETVEPFRFQEFRYSVRALDGAHSKRLQLLHQLKESYDTNRWEEETVLPPREIHMRSYEYGE